MKLLFENAKIMDVHSPHHGEVLDILIEGDKILEIGKGLSAKKVVDLKGKIITPGLFDLFAHFNEPGHEHKEDLASGKKAATFAGFTDVCLIPNTEPVIDSKSDVNFLKSRSGEGVDLHVLGAVSVGCNGENLTEILDLEAAGAIAFTDGLAPIWNTELLLKALQYMHKFDGLIINRPKDIHLSQFSHMHEGEVSTMLGLKGEPSISEEIAIKRDLEILKYAGGRMHFSHLSTAKSVKLISRAKKKGLAVSCDVAIHQLVYSDKDLSDYDSHLKVDPPFRTEKDRKALIRGLKDGTIDAIVSSHQPQDPENKDLEFDLASTGINSLPTVINELLKIQDDLPLEIAIEKLSSGPRKVLQMTNVIIEQGAQARFSIFDLEKTWNFNLKSNPSQSHNSPLFGKELTGKCFGTYNHGHFYQND